MSENKKLLPHHKQQSLCTSRLPYRQGRKLTAVKVYTIAMESNHLLIFGVPSFNLRQETKTLFMKFGKLLQFNMSPDYSVEPFTETYHAQYEQIKSAREAKRMIDTKNFYGGSLHVCYAPELETIIETKQKLTQREKDVVNRLRNLELEKSSQKHSLTNKINDETIKTVKNTKTIINMGEFNILDVKNKRILPKKRKTRCKIVELDSTEDFKMAQTDSIPRITSIEPPEKIKCTEIVDFTSVDKEVLTNINESLNYKQFGNEVIRKIEQKPLNRITINIHKKLV